MNDIRIPGFKRRKKATIVVDETPKPSQKMVDVLIVGAGFAGLGTAIRLRQAGVHNVVILERGTEVGGTWRDNQYPGAACDIVSNLYSYSFAQNPDWSRSFSGSGEILGYIRQLVKRFDLERLIRFGQNVTGMVFDEPAGIWNVNTADGQTHRARAVVMCQGPLSNSSWPKIPGLETYRGHKIHSARWDHGYDFRGKKVAVVGTGASSIQIVPELVKQAAQVKVFQRTPGWVMPRPDYVSPEWSKKLFARVPAAQSAFRELLFWVHESMALGVVWTTPMTSVMERLMRMYLRSEVKDPWLRRQLTPDFRLGCKRILISNDWYKSLQAPNCELVTWPIAGMSPKGIRTVEGIEHQFDCIVFATGFDVSKAGSPFPVTGLGGRNLDSDWARGAQAYKSVNVSGYPNVFLTFGPNSGPGHNSALVYMEAQIGYIVRGVGKLLGEDLAVLDVKPEVQKAHNDEIQKRLRRTNWNSGCKSWYLTEDGFNSTMYPGLATQYRSQMARFDGKAYRTVPMTVREPV
ncbi:MAG: monooxygenase [Panacagrimonas sp.]|jgi:cation diffusion facilitator CzcD-associated flavoprotein CzcO|nr:NAD(P)/FAD-dependent oxidoreductase [Panacagrimonas sp.]MCC2656804.1 monooxygenase [Panacagrimonas sp.]